MSRFHRLLARARDLADYAVALLFIAILAAVLLLAMGDQVSRVLSTVSTPI